MSDYDDLTDDDIDVLAEDDSRPWAVGDEVTVLVAGIAVPWGLPGSGNIVCRRGDVLKVTRDTLRHRADFLDLVADPVRQAERWGVQKIARGRHSVERWAEAGDREWLEARALARDIAFAEIDPVKRAEALAAVSRRFGSAPAPRTTNTYRDLAEQRRVADEAHARALQGRHIVKSTAE